jgi:hypothetical protein
MTPSAKARRATLVVSSALALAAGAITVAPAQAAVDDWVRISPSANPNFATPASARTPDGTQHVIWQVDGGNFEHVAIAPNGRRSAVSRVLAAPWSAVSSYPDLVAMPDGSLRLLFTGKRTGGTADFFDGKGIYNAVSTDGGATWTVPNEIYARAVGGGDHALGAVLPDGRVLAGHHDTAGFHFRIGAGNDAEAAIESVNTDVAIAGAHDYSIVASGGVVWLTYNVGDANSTVAQQIWPSIGAQVRPPVTTGYSYAGTPVVDRPGVGAVAAFEAGYGTSHQVYVWELAANRVRRVPGFAGPNNVFLDVLPDGHLWIGATGPINYQPRASRVAKSGWTIDRRPALLPGAYSTFDGTVAATSTLGSTLVMSGKITASDSTEGMLAHQVMATLNVRATPRRWRIRRTQRVAIKVTDVDGAVAGARVRAGDERCRTNSRGVCRLRFTASVRPRQIRVKVTKRGYYAGSAKLVVRR